MGGGRFAEDVKVIGFDGDDTLWHSEDAFAQAQQRLVGVLAAHASDTEVAAQLQAIQRRNLDLFGYGIKAFTLCMIETAIELSSGSVPVTDIEHLLRTGQEMLARPVDLLAGVAETLPRLADNYRLALITKGDLLNQESKIARSGLMHMFETVNILSEKTADAYLKILRTLEIEPEQFLMVGNSEVSDARPVLAMQGWVALVPYPLTAAHERGSQLDQLSPRVRILERIDQLPPLLSGASQPPS